MTEAPTILNLLHPAASPKIDEKAQVLEQQKTLQVLPLGIIETKPLVESIQNNAQLNAEALRETSKELHNLRETVLAQPLPESNQPVIERLDKLLKMFEPIAKAAVFEIEVLGLVKAELTKT